MKMNQILAFLGLLLSIYFLFLQSKIPASPGASSSKEPPTLSAQATGEKTEIAVSNVDSTAAASVSPTELFFSEYIEGTSNNKALEIYNGTGSTVDLNAGKYSVEMYFNGDGIHELIIPLTGSVANGDVYILAQSSAGAAILSQADQTSSAGWYNGDDSVLLTKDGAIIDSIGQIGFDPGTEWGSGLISTSDNTLQRRSSSCQGDLNASDEFFPAQQWEGFATDTISGLGAHTATCTSVIGSCGGAAEKIHDIQGAGTSSPFAGQDKIIEGVVTGDFQGSAKLGGFFLQEESPDVDADPVTSEGIFVYDQGFGIDVSAGQVIRVLGNVREYYKFTELSNVSALQVCPTTASIAPVTVSLPVTNVSNWEPLEGMLITLPQQLYVTDNYTLGRYGEVELSAYGRLYTPTQLVSPGSMAIQQQGLNDRSRIQLDDGSNAQNPLPLPPYLGLDNTLRLGDTLTGVTGVLAYAFDKYEIHPTVPVSFTRTNQRTTELPAVASGSLKIVSMNLLNYFTTLDTGTPNCGPSGTLDCRGANTEEEFTRQRTKTLAAFKAMEPDIAGVMEVENNASAAIQDLVDGLNDTFGAGTYDYINTGTIGTDAIKVGIIYKPAKVTPIGAFKILDSSVDPDFLDTKNRPSLAQTFETASDSRFTIVVNHLKSKGSSCSDVGDVDMKDGQGNCNQTRTKAVEALINWLASDPTDSNDPDFLLIGDFNSYAKEDPVSTLKNAGYVNLIEYFQGSPVYSYTFEGQSGTLDYAFASPGLVYQVWNTLELHVNADEPPALDYNNYNQPGLYTPDIFRYADHDPLIMVVGPIKPLVFMPLLFR